MNIRINRSSQTPIYLQIKCAIQNLILSGELSPGYKMPAERKLAGELDTKETGFPACTLRIGTGR